MNKNPKINQIHDLTHDAEHHIRYGHPDKAIADLDKINTLSRELIKEVAESMAPDKPINEAEIRTSTGFGSAHNPYF